MPTPNGGTWTLTTYFGQMLSEAEELYGHRDLNWAPIGVEFFIASSSSSLRPLAAFQAPLLCIHRQGRNPRGEAAGLSLEKTVQHLSSAGDRSLARTFSHFEQKGLLTNDHTVKTSSIGKRPVSRSASVGSQFGKTSRICFGVISRGCLFFPGNRHGDYSQWNLPPR
jgi:hypothetical protein